MLFDVDGVDPWLDVSGVGPWLDVSGVDPWLWTRRKVIDSCSIMADSGFLWLNMVDAREIHIWWLIDRSALGTMSSH